METEYVFCKNLDSDYNEIHIHKVKYNRHFQEESICRKHNVNDHKYKVMSKIVDRRRQEIFDEYEARDIAAEFQNEGKEVCGICVSHLYYTESGV